MSDKDYTDRGVPFHSYLLNRDSLLTESDLSNAREQKQKGVSVDLHRNFFFRDARARQRAIYYRADVH